MSEINKNQPKNNESPLEKTIRELKSLDRSLNKEEEEFLKSIEELNELDKDIGKGFDNITRDVKIINDTAQKHRLKTTVQLNVLRIVLVAFIIFDLSGTISLYFGGDSLVVTAKEFIRKEKVGGRKSSDFYLYFYKVDIGGEEKVISFRFQQTLNHPYIVTKYKNKYISGGKGQGLWVIYKKLKGSYFKSIYGFICMFVLLMSFFPLKRLVKR